MFFGTAEDLFKITASGAYTKLTPVISSHSLSGSLFPASDGLLYGSQGQIFATNLQGDVKVLQTVEGLNGGLIEAANGSLYGIYSAGQTSRHFLSWGVERRVELAHIQPGKPVQNAFIESFNGRLRDECLKIHCSVTCGTEDVGSRTGAAITTPKGHPAA